MCLDICLTVRYLAATRRVASGITGTNPGFFRLTSLLPLIRNHSALSVQYIDGLRGTLVIYGSAFFFSLEEGCFELTNVDPDEPLAHLYGRPYMFSL